MAKGIAADLMLRLRANSAELQKGLDESKKSLKNLEKNTASIGTQMVKAFSVMAAGAFSFKAALDFTKKAIGSTQGTADAYAGVVQGLNFGTQSLARSMAQLDFDNLINGFAQAYKAGKAYAAVLDEVGDRQNSLIVQEARYSLEISKQERILRDRTSTAEQRLAAEEEIRRLSEEQLALQRQVLEKRLQGEEVIIRNLITGKQLTKDQIDLVKDYAANYINLSEDATGAINNLGAQWKRLERTMTAVGNTQAVQSRAARKAQEELNKLMEQVPEEARKYIPVAFAINNYTGEQRQNLVKILAEQYSIEKSYERINTRLDTQAYKTEQLGDNQEKNTEQLKKDEAILQKIIALNKQLEQIKYPKLELPEFEGIAPRIAPIIEGAPVFDKTKPVELPEPKVLDPKKLIDVQPAIVQVNELDAALVKVYETWGILNGLDSPFAFITDSFRLLTDTLSEGANSMKEFANEVIISVKQIIGALLAETVANAVSQALKNPAITVSPLLIPVFAALAAGLAKTAFNTLVPTFAEGGIVSGPTYVMVGEYPGAKTNPEVIAPLSKLRDLIGDNQPRAVRFVIEQDQLVGILDNYNKKQIYF